MERLPRATQLLPAFEQALEQAITVRARDTGWQPWSEEEVTELRHFNIEGGNAAGSVMADGLGQADTLVVVTGQQPNLLASPLYILHKGLSAVAWARKLGERTGRRVVPVFWVASDDHDFEELRDCWVLEPELKNGRRGDPTGRPPVNASALANLGSSIGRGDDLPPGSPAFRWKIEPYIDQILSRYYSPLLDEELLAKSSTFEDLFIRTLTALLGPKNPVLFVAPRLHALRRRQRPILEREIRGQLCSNQLLSAAGARMEAAGYRVGMERNDHLVNAFYLDRGVRRRIVRSGGVLQLQDAAKHTVVREVAPTELLDELQENPENFTTNVVSRPLLQDSALPSVAYLAGPGEIAYLAQLGPVYQAHGVTRAAVGLRAMLTLVHPHTRQALGELGLPQDASLAEARERLLSAETPGRLLQPVEQLEATLQDGVGEMEAELSADYAHLRPAFRKTRASLQRSIARLRERVSRQADPAAWNRVARAVSLMSPRGQSQERWLSPLDFLLPGEPSALAEHLACSADYTQSAPQVVELPDAQENAG